MPRTVAITRRCSWYHRSQSASRVASLSPLWLIKIIREPRACARASGRAQFPVSSALRGFAQLAQQAAAIHDFRIDTHRVVGLPCRSLHRGIDGLAQIALEHVEHFERTQLRARHE